MENNKELINADRILNGMGYAVEEKKEEEGKKIEIVLPDNVKRFVDPNVSVFDIEDNVDPTLLAKYLFYMPEISRIFGVAIAQLKREKRTLERAKVRKESEIILDCTFGFESHKFKNEQARNAKVQADLGYQGLCKEVDDIEGQIDEMYESVWKYKNLLQSLDNISKLKISERKF